MDGIKKYKDHIELCKDCVVNCACRDCKVNGIKPSNNVDWYDYCLCGYDISKTTCKSFKKE